MFFFLKILKLKCSNVDIFILSENDHIFTFKTETQKIWHISVMTNPIIN